MAAMALQSATKVMAGWGRYPVATGAWYRPERRREVAEVLAFAPEPNLLPRGLGRSYGDAAVNGGGALIEMTRLDRCLAFDEARGLLVAEAGLSIDTIFRVFGPRGWFVPVSPGTRFVTLGGAIANDVHGKNHHKAGSFGDFVDELTLLTPGGEVVTCGPEVRPEVFWATVGGLGLTGVILTVTLRLVRRETAWVRVDTRRLPGLEATLEAMRATDDDYEYSVAWIDCLATGRALGRSVLMQGIPAGLADLDTAVDDPLALPPKPPLAVPFDLPGWVVNPLTVRAFNALYYGVHGDEAYGLVDLAAYFYPLDSIHRWNRLYGRRGFLQYQVTFPPDEALAGLTAVLKALSGAGAASFLAVLKRFGDAGRGLLSYPSPGAFLALDLPRRPATEALLRDLEPAVLARGGRLYAAKDAVMSAGAFAQMYPRLAEFRAVKRELDPRGRLSSSLARRLGILDG